MSDSTAAAGADGVTTRPPFVDRGDGEEDAGKAEFLRIAVAQLDR